MNLSSSSSSSKRKKDLVYDEIQQSNCKRRKNDVFLNYLFQDIGNSYKSHLHGALTCNGFTVSDHTMIPVGHDMCSKVLESIEDSDMYVVVFSHNYASSVRSLDELANIMDCRGKKMVYPVFYKLQPSDVKLRQEGPFKEAFQALEADDTINPERVDMWKKALRDACKLAGSTLHINGDEEKSIRIIVKEVSKMKNPQELCDVEHPVGIVSRAQDVISALRLSDPTFAIVAVFGISGSRKTTIVKAVYDRITADFDVSCFIQDIHSYEYRGNWKVDLQKDVISCLTGNDKFIGSHNDGEKFISGRKVLLVLDDVYTFEQLQAISIHSASFYCGSRIIVTTRNKESLSNLPHTPYNMSMLDTRESFELFTRLVGKGDPIDMKFVDEIVKCAGGIPLILEVWSRHFTNYERKLWPSMLEMLKRIPHEDTQKKLRISYDSLPKRAQNLFLDIACFFHGMSRRSNRQSIAR